MKIKILLNLRVLLVLLTGIFITACTTDDTAQTRKASKAPAQAAAPAETAAPATADANKPSATITKGMPQEEVLKLLGEPHRKESMKASDGGKVEFWRYERIIGQKEKFQVTGTEMVEQWSPNQGQFIEVPEQVEELVLTTVSQVVEIIMHDGKVLTFKADLHQDIEGEQ